MRLSYGMKCDIKLDTAKEQTDENRNRISRKISIQWMMWDAARILSESFPTFRCIGMLPRIY